MAPTNLPPCVGPQPVSAIVPRALIWLWSNRLAAGKLAILEGDPGLGKSLVALDLCARLSTGRAFPDGAPTFGLANSLVINGEDGDDDTIVPRLAALGADLKRVFVLPREGGGGLPLRLPSRLDRLEDAIHATAAKMVVIDPIVAFLDPGIQVGNEAHIRHALLPLAELAGRHHCVPLLVRHLTKSTSHRSTYRGGGSIGLLGMCRSGWLVAAHPRKPKTQRVLAEVKNNLSAPQPSLAYEVHQEDNRTVGVHWLDTCPWNADQLLAAVGKRPVVAKVLFAIDFLRSFLKEGPRTVPEIWTAAREERLSRTTLERAKRELEIRSRKVYIDGYQRNYWLMPRQELPGAAGSAEAEQWSLEPWLAPLRERFPEPTPIDDI